MRRETATVTEALKPNVPKSGFIGAEKTHIHVYIIVYIMCIYDFIAVPIVPRVFMVLFQLFNV